MRAACLPGGSRIFQSTARLCFYFFGKNAALPQRFCSSIVISERLPALSGFDRVQLLKRVGPFPELPPTRLCFSPERRFFHAGIPPLIQETHRHGSQRSAD